MTASTQPDPIDCRGRARTFTPRPRRSTSIRRILDEVCRDLHDSFSADVLIVLDDTPPLHATHEPTARAVFEQLLWGLVEASQALHAGKLELHIRPGMATNRVLASIDVIPDEHIDEFRSRVLRLLVEQRDDPLLGHDLDGASVAIRDAGGTLLCREGDDGRLWVQVGLPAELNRPREGRASSG